jgi:hypothetical protein
VLLACTTVALVVIAVAVVRTMSWAPALALSWLLVPVVVACVESLLGQSIFLPRNLLICLPAVALLLAWGITRRGVPVPLGALALAALLALRALQLAPTYGVSPEDWRAATGYVVAHAAAADCVAFYPSDGRNAFRYYLHGGAREPQPMLPVAPLSCSRAYIEDYATLSTPKLRLLPAGCPRLWLVSSHEGQANGTAGSRANYSRYLALRNTLATAYARTQVRSFGYAAPVTVELFAGEKAS